jgi:hypothetical protein
MISLAVALIWLHIAAHFFIYALAQTPIDHPDDVAALGQLFNQTSGSSWTNKSGWIDWMNRPHLYSVCNAHGVACNSTNGRVVALNLARNGLKGPSGFSTPIHQHCIHLSVLCIIIRRIGI